MLMQKLPHCLLNFSFFSQRSMFFFSKTFFLLYTIKYLTFWDALFLLAKTLLQLIVETSFALWLSELAITFSVIASYFTIGNLDIIGGLFQ